MRLVANPLQQVQRLAPSGDRDRLVPPRQVDLFEPLRQADGGDVDPELGEHSNGSPQLTGTTVYNDKRRRVGELAPLLHGQLPIDEVRGEATPQRLLHGGEVVLAGDRPDPEAPVVRLLRQPVFKDDHRSNRVPPLDR